MDLRAPRLQPARSRPAAKSRNASPPHSVAFTTRLERDADIEIVAPAAVVDPTDHPVSSAAPDPEHRAEEDRRRLRESIKDLARVLEAITGAHPRIASSASAPTVKTYSFLIGAAAEKVFGGVGVAAPFEQGFRVVVGERRAGLFGQSDLATSYAVYELLDRLGCRWFFPGDLGEVLPPRGPLELPRLEIRSAPSTWYRGVWYADDAWKRRNRQGGLLLAAGQILETYLQKDLPEHPDWVATIGGKAHPNRIKWSKPEVAARAAEVILATHARREAPSYSLSPADGIDFDDSAEDRALDAGDFDPTLGQVSLTDRFLVFANRVATRVAAQQPNLLLGFLAYTVTTRPPVREKVHPNLVPQIAPITYDRTHPMSDEHAPGNAELRRIIEGWGSAARATSMYFYGWFLSAPVAPNPLRTKWGFDVPFVLSHGVRFWQPETLPTFESTMHALYMGMRLAFDATLRPDDVYDDLDTRLYGSAAQEMSAYWRYVDATWVESPEYSGGPFGQARRFTPERLAEMRRLLDAAKKAARTDVERRRIGMADDSLALFAAKMSIRFDFVEGHFRGLDEQARRWKRKAAELGDRYADVSAFGKTFYAPETIYARYFGHYEEPSYDEAARIASTAHVDEIVRTFRWTATEEPSADLHRAAPLFDDSTWKSTDVALDSWSRLGLHDWFHSVWYRAKLTVAHRALGPGRGRQFFVWLGAGDGAFRVFVNGHEARYVARSGSPARPEGAGWFTFDVAGLLSEGENTLAILASRTELNELGIGGLTGPVALYHE